MILVCCFLGFLGDFFGFFSLSSTYKGLTETTSFTAVAFLNFYPNPLVRVITNVGVDAFCSLGTTTKGHLLLSFKQLKRCNFFS